MTGETDLSIVIPVINEWPHLFYTVHSAMEDLAEENISYEIVVVDNGSRPEQIEPLLPLVDHYPLRLLGYKEHLSISLSLREGIRFANGKYICFVGGHTLFSRMFFRRMLSVLESGKADGALCPVTYGWSWPLDSSHTKLYQYYLEPYNQDEGFGAGYSFDVPENEEPYAVAAQASLGFTFRKSAWLDIGETNPGIMYGGGGWEKYIMLKFWMFDHPLLLVPSVTAVHLNSPRDYPHSPGYPQRRNNFITYHSLGGPGYAGVLVKTHRLRAITIPGYMKDRFESEQDDPGDVEACYDEALQYAQPEWEYISRNAKHRFTDLWDWFDENHVYWRKPL